VNLKCENIVNLDVTNVKSSKEFHQCLKTTLEFPDFYGMNWDAFWDTITGLISLPEEINIIGWKDVVHNLPEEAKSFEELMELYNVEFSMCKCIIKYNI